MKIWKIILLTAVIGLTLLFCLFYLCAIFYFKFGFCKGFYHDILAWHQPDDSHASFDGCSVHCRCKYCKKDIMQDSQGNWF